MLFHRSFLVSVIALLLLQPGLLRAQQHFTDCLNNDVNDATVLIPKDITISLGTIDSLSTGDEVALFSNDDTCAGVGVWNENEEALSVAVAGVDTTAGISDGYELDEPLKYRIWRQLDGQVFEISSASYTCTLPGCRSDGLYEADAFYEVTEMSSSPLPVELTTFKATRAGSSVVLEWRTASETDNAGFKVQHRTDPSESWATLTFVDGAGTSSNLQSYRYETDELEYGTHAFRLAQLDRDGAKNTSKTIDVQLRLSTAYELSKVNPNPVRVYDLLGREQAVLLDRKLPATQTKTLQLNADRWPSGSYFVRVEGADFQATRRLTVVK